MVLTQNIKVSKSAKMLDIRPTTARLIISTFLKENRVFERKEER